jgi:hypothetical protein
MSNIIGVKYITGREDDGSLKLSDREYSYFCDVEVEINEEIDVPARNSWAAAVVTAVDIPEEKIAGFKQFVKTITEKKKPMVFTAEEESPQVAMSFKAEDDKKNKIDSIF